MKGNLIVYKVDGGFFLRCLVNIDVKVDGVFGFFIKMNKEFEYISNLRLNIRVGGEG